jgi:hypothetical protein
MALLLHRVTSTLARMRVICLHQGATATCSSRTLRADLRVEQPLLTLSRSFGATERCRRQPRIPHKHAPLPTLLLCNGCSVASVQLLLACLGSVQPR